MKKFLSLMLTFCILSFFVFSVSSVHAEDNSSLESSIPSDIAAKMENQKESLMAYQDFSNLLY